LYICIYIYLGFFVVFLAETANSYLNITCRLWFRPSGMWCLSLEENHPKTGIISWKKWIIKTPLWRTQISHRSLCISISLVNFQRCIFWNNGSAL